jgi:hypothetical protein
MVSDHVVATPDVGEQYPAPFYESFTTLAWLSGLTSTIRLGTTVLIVPYRHPLLIARMAADLNDLSGYARRGTDPAPASGVRTGPPGRDEPARRSESRGDGIHVGGALPDVRRRAWLGWPVAGAAAADQRRPARCRGRGTGA